MSDYYDPTNFKDMPTSALRARCRYYLAEMTIDQRHYCKLMIDGALTRKQALKIMGIDKLTQTHYTRRYQEARKEIMHREPSVDPTDLLRLYAELHDTAKEKNQIANAKSCLDAMAKISGADQPRLDTHLPTNAGAEEMALAIVSQITSGELALRDGQELLRAIETGAKLSLTQRAIDSAPGGLDQHPLTTHKPGTEAWLNARKFAENLALLRAVDASPLTLVGDNNDD